MNSWKKLVIIGAGGHGKVCADSADLMQCFEEICFLDAKAESLDRVANWDVVDTPDSFERFIDEETGFFVAIGNNTLRRQWLDRLQAAGASIVTLIHPNASLARDVKLGVGTLIMSGAIVNIHAEIKRGCIVNTAATVGHDCLLGDCVQVSPGVNLAGAVVLEDQVFVGVGAKIIQELTVGAGTTIGAGATVIKSIPANVTALGTPTRVVKPSPAPIVKPR